MQALGLTWVIESPVSLSPTIVQPAKVIRVATGTARQAQRILRVLGARCI